MAIEKQLEQVPFTTLDKDTTFIAERDGAWQRVKLDFANGLPIGDATITYDAVNERLVINIP